MKILRFEASATNYQTNKLPL